MTTALSHSDYPAFLAALKERIICARISAARAVNHVRGFSADNLWRMRQFFAEYSAVEFLEQAVPELKARFLAQAVPESAASPAVGKSGESLSQAMRELVAPIPWGHHLELLKKIKAPAARLYYLRATAQLGWSRSVLLNQIMGGVPRRRAAGPKDEAPGAAASGPLVDLRAGTRRSPVAEHDHVLGIEPRSSRPWAASRPASWHAGLTIAADRVVNGRAAGRSWPPRPTDARFRRRGIMGARSNP